MEIQSLSFLFVDKMEVFDRFLGYVNTLLSWSEQLV